MKFSLKNIYFKVFWSSLLGLCLAYCWNTYFTYVKWKKYNRDFELSTEYLIKNIGYVWRDVETFFQFGWIIFIFYPLYFGYGYVLYKVLKSDNPSFIEYHGLVLTLLFFLFFLFCSFFAEMMVM